MCNLVYEQCGHKLLERNLPYVFRWKLYQSGIEAWKFNWNNHVNQVFPNKTKTIVQIAFRTHVPKTGEVAAAI